MKEDDIRKRDIFNKYLELSKKDIELFFNDESKFIDINCPACKSEKSLFCFEKNKFSYYQCENCDTLFVNPRPSIEQFDKYYTDSESTKYWVNEFFKPVAEIRREKIFRPRAIKIAAILAGKQNLTIGDIGTGFGIFLEELAKTAPGNRLIAIEPSKEMAEMCRAKNLIVIEKLLENIEDSIGYYDVLTSFELFEHLFDPAAFLNTVHRLLKPGGLFIMTTLNGLGFDIRILWDKSKSLTPPHHLNFFNPKAFEILFGRVGFEIESITTPGMLDVSIVEGAHNQEKVQIDRFMQTLYKYASEEAKEELQKWIARYNFSSHIMVVARKKYAK